MPKRLSPALLSLRPERRSTSDPLSASGSPDRRSHSSRLRGYNTAGMRATKRKRAMRREQVEPPQGVDLAELALRASYEGSAEHKDYLSAAGPAKLRTDATPCPRDLKDQGLLTEWLREAIRAGHIGAPWEDDFPRYAWVRKGERCFEARLSNRQAGIYKGYPMEPDEVPKWL